MNTDNPVSQETEEPTNIVEFAIGVLIHAIEYNANQANRWREIADLLFSDPEQGIPIYKEARDDSN